MFCPPKYVPVVELFRHWQDQRHSADVRRIEEHFAPKGSDSRHSEKAGFHWFAPSDLSEHEFFAALDGQLFMASKTGELLRLANTCFVGLKDGSCPRDSLDYYSADLEDAEEQRRAYDVLGRRYETEYQLFDLDDQFFFRLLEQERSSQPEITLWELADNISQGRKHQIVSLCHERIAYTIDLRMHDYLANRGLITEHLEAAAPHLRPFQGWALCVPQEFVTSARWLKCLEEVNEAALNRLDHEEPSRSVSRGRPPVLRQRLRAAYRHLYPNGHGNETWPWVLRRVQKEAGLNWDQGSVDTLRRALDEESES